MSLLTDWNNLDPLSPEEFVLLNQKLHHLPEELTDLSNVPLICKSEKDWKALTKQWFDLMLGSNITENDHYLTFNTCCSNFIRELFDKYATDDTLVISSDCEHPTVKKCLENCKNKLILSQRQDIRKFNFEKIKDAIKNYKKVFVYIIAIRNDTGEITPQSFMIQLKELLKEKQHIMVLDDVQGMFLVPRDYTLYDYVLGTGHVIVDQFELGIMISKEFYNGIRALNWGRQYLVPLKIALKRLNKLTQFREYCNEYFKNYITDKNISKELCVGHIFYISGKKFVLPREFALKLEPYHILIMDENVITPAIRLRALGYIVNPTVFEKALKIFQYALDAEELNQKVIEDIINE